MFFLSKWILLVFQWRQMAADDLRAESKNNINHSAGQVGPQLYQVGEEDYTGGTPEKKKL